MCKIHVNKLLVSILILLVKVYICAVNPITRFLNFCVCCILFSTTLFAQAPTNQDCPNAIPICNLVYSTTLSYSGTGNIPNEINSGSSCLLSGEKNDVWYTFTTPFFGNLNFTITPNNPLDDYDWAVYNLTTATCADIFTNPAIEVSCNYAPNLGCGGVTGPNNNTAGPCGGQNNPSIPVTPGQTYVINVSNYSATQSGYTIDFSASTGSIFDVYPPMLLTTTPITCGSTSITLTFNENITCNSVQPTDFVLTGPGGPFTITSVTSTGCASGADYSKVYTVTFSPAISVSGVYNFAIVSPVQDLCGNNISVPTNKAILINGATVTEQHTNNDCNGDNDGSITLTPAGVGPFTYQWSPNVSTTNTASNLAAGTYTITVTPSNGACNALATINITEPTAMSVQSQNIDSAMCGSASGSIAVVMTGGTAPYQYQWSPSGGTAATANNLTPGNYTLDVTDANGCDFSQTFTVYNKNNIAVNVNGINNVNCKNGSDGGITLNVNGASAGVTYLWSNGATTKDLTNVPAGIYTVTVTDGLCQTVIPNLLITEPATALSVSTTATATTCGQNNGSITVNASGGTGALSYQWAPSGSGSASTSLASGVYVITVTDANGCTAVRNVNVAASTNPNATINYIRQTVLCHNDANGSAIISVTSGTAPYTYLWSGGMGTAASNSSLSPGNYVVTVTDNAGCTTTAVVTINNAPQLVLTAGAVQHVKCYGQNSGSATYVGSGGTGALTYQWSPSGGTGTTASNLSAGTYTVLLTDANSCTVSSSVVIQQPAAALSNQFTATATTCGLSNGAATATVAGGTPPYSYLWSNNATTGTATALAAGTYTVTITDANQCTLTQSTSIAPSSAPAIANTNIQNLTCAGAGNGSIAIQVSGGVQPYTYQWSNNVSTTNNASSLNAGNYTVTITDQSGCTTSATYSVTSPANITVQLISSQNVDCYGDATGALQIAASGGTGTLNYTWSNGGNGAGIAALTAGSYSVTVTDQNNCTAQQTYNISQPASALTSVTTANNTSCGLNNGTALTTPAGGTAPYKYLWSTGSNAAQINNLASGTYTVIVSDFLNCSVTQSATVQPSTAVAIQNTSQSNVTCNGGNDGAASVAVSGGIAPYTYQWTGGQSTASIQNLNAGSYTVIITDQEGCTETTSFTITQPAAIVVTLPATQTVCELQNTTVAPQITGGTAPYQYLWSDGSTQDTLSVNPSTGSNYLLTVTDDNGCTASATTAINIYPQLTLAAFNSYSVCENSTVSLTANVSGGNGVYTYNWDNGASSNKTYSKLFTASATVSLTVSDGCNYTTSASVPVNVVPNPVIIFTAENTAGCIPLTVNFTDSSQAVAGSVYTWNTGAGNPPHQGGNFQITYAQAGIYYPELTITTPAPESCTATKKMTDGIQALELPVADFKFDPEEPTILNPYVSFVNLSQFATSYVWDFGDGSTSSEENPLHHYNLIGTYEVLLTASNSYCEDTALRTLEVTEQYSFYIPNSFTPNTDGKNDLFEAYGTNITSANIAVFNRWGMKVFESSVMPFSWNGKKMNSGEDLPQGIYVYTVKLTDKTGHSHSYNGTVALIR